MIRTSRTFARFVWYHVPLRLENETSNQSGAGDENKEKTEKLKVVRRVMAEKRMALDLIEAYVLHPYSVSTC